MDTLQLNALLSEIKASASLAAGRTPVAQRTKAADFQAMLKSSIDEVNGTQGKAQALAREFQLGNPNVSLEDAMVALQKSSLSFQFAVQVRNKIIAAYHDVMNMQV